MEDLILMFIVGFYIGALMASVGILANIIFRMKGDKK